MADDHRSVYEALLAVEKQGTPAALATITDTQGSMPRHAGSKMLVYADGRIVGTIGGGAMESKVIQEAQQVIQNGVPVVKTYTLNSLDAGDPGICGGTATLFIEPVGFSPSLLIIGGGHVGRALAELGKWSGFRVILSDDRPEFCRPEYVPDLDDYVVCSPAEVTEKIAMNHLTYVAAVTRGLPVDIQLLPKLLQTNAAYIGLIGSRRRWAITVKALKEDVGLSDEEIQRIHAPIGLELQAETPKEIAVSILAEMIMVRRGGTGQPMKWFGDTPDV